MEEIWRDLELSSKELCSGFIYEPCFSNQDDVEWVFGGLETTIETDNVRGFQNLELLETEDGEEFGHRADGVDGVEYEGVKSEGSAVEKRAENFCCVGSWIGSPRFMCSSSSWAASGARSPSVTRPHGISPTLLDSSVIVSNSQPSPTTGTLVIPDADVISATVDSATLGVKKCDGHASFTYNSHESAVSLACLPGLGNMVSPAYEMAQSMGPELDCCVTASVQPRDDHSTSTEQLHIKDTAKNFNSCSPAEVSNNIAVNANSPAWQLHDPIDTSGSEACPDDEPPTAEENDDSEIDPMQKVASTPVGILRTSDDGYNWRKYGQKQVKGSEYPRSYYKCTHLDCPVKKKIERSQDGQITEIIYKGDHNHPILHPNRCSTLGSVLSFSESPEASRSCVKADGSPGSRRTEDQSEDLIVVTARRVDGSERIHSTAGVPDMLATEGNLVGVLGSASMPSFASQEEKEDAASEGSMSLADDDYDESGSKERKEEGSIIEWMFSSRDRREPRVVVQTESQVDILDDGYRWRKYGQKVVKGNQNPRSYYKCTSAGCTVRKHVERASQDLKYVLTMYVGKHNHEIPVARNSSNRNSAGDSPPAAVNTPAVFTLPSISHLPKHEPQDLVPVFNPKVGYCTDFLRPYYLDNLVGNAPLFYPMKSASFPDAIPYGSFGSSLNTIDPYSRPMVLPFSIPLPFEFPCPSDLTVTGCNNHNAPVAGFQSFFAEQEVRAHNMKYLRPKDEMEVDSFCCAGVSKIEQMR